MNKKGLKKGKILGIDVSSAPRDKVLAKIDYSLKKNRKIFITTPNPEIVLEANSNSRLKKAINSSDIAIPDGVGLVWAMRSLGISSKVSLIKGRELFIDILKMADEQNLRVFFLGSTEEVNKRAIKKAENDYKNARFRGFSGPSLNKKGKTDTEVDVRSYKDTLDMINSFKPDVLFVAFGAPKQEIWADDNRGKLSTKAIMTIGGTLDYYSGAKPLPPKWIEMLNLEWAWRLVNEPGHIRRVYRALIIFPIVAFWKELF